MLQNHLIMFKMLHYFQAFIIRRTSKFGMVKKMYCLSTFLLYMKMKSNREKVVIRKSISGK